MNKSEFYLKWYSEHVNKELNAQGYPQQIFKGEEITTAEQWTEFLETELELDVIKRINPEAYEILELNSTFKSRHFFEPQIATFLAIWAFF